jgi:sodium transport system permease protein
MKNNTWTIIKKECARFFGDRTMLMTTVIMPGLLIYLIYSFMGNNFMQPKDEEPAIMYVENLPESVHPVLEALPLVMVTENFDAEKLRNELVLKDSKYILLVFPEDFDSLTAQYDPISGHQMAPNVQLLYNSASEPSQQAYSMVSAALDAYESTICNRFDINNSVDGSAVYDLASNEDVVGNFFSELIPMLLLLMAFSGCMSIAPPSIAGEKERGTIATLLVTPLKRRELALGKVLSLSFFAMLSGLSSFLGMMLSLPKLIHADEMGLDANIYQVSDYVTLLLLIFSTVLILVSVTSIISAKAKSVKAASAVMAPLMLVVMLVGMIPMMSGTKVDSIAYYLIPIYNSVLAMSQVFAHEAHLLPIIITIAANALYTGLGIWVLTKMFNSEKVMFSK